MDRPFSVAVVGPLVEAASEILAGARKGIPQAETEKTQHSQIFF
jgi:hypothetical protein